MLSLKHLKSYECHQVTREHPVYTMVFLYDLLTEHSRVLVFSLLVNSDSPVTFKVILRVDDSSSGIKTVPLRVYIISEHIQARTDGYRNIRSLCKKLKQELQQLPAPIFILFRKIFVLAFHRKI